MTPVDERHRIRIFIARFNSIHSFLAKRYVEPKKWIDFSSLIAKYHQDHKGWGDDYYDLKAFAALRNVISHQEREPDKHLFVPSAEAVARIEQILTKLQDPEKLIPRFGVNVVTVRMEDPVCDALRIIFRASFSQLPVYGAKTFRGLLTENGITRWLAHRATNARTDVDLGAVIVADMFSEEENRANYDFVDCETHVSDLIQQFAENPGLEAALITKRGKRDEPLLGIATQWDILEAMKTQ